MKSKFVMIGRRWHWFLINPSNGNEIARSGSGYADSRGARRGLWRFLLNVGSPFADRMKELES